MNVNESKIYSVHLDIFRYFLGLDPVTRPNQPVESYTFGSVIPMSYSNFATFIISDKNDKNKEYLYKWIDVNAHIHPEYLDGTPFVSGDTVTPGTVIRIPPIGPKVQKLSDPKMFYNYYSEHDALYLTHLRIALYV